MKTEMIPTDAELATYLDQIGEFDLASAVRGGLLDENQMACIADGYEFDRPKPEPEHPMERAFGALASLTGETMRERIAVSLEVPCGGCGYPVDYLVHLCDTCVDYWMAWHVRHEVGA